MLTKGDVLAFLGKASGPLGSYEGKEVKVEMKAVKTESVKAEAAKVGFSSGFCDCSTLMMFGVGTLSEAAFGRTCAPQTYSHEPSTVIIKSTQRFKCATYSFPIIGS
jgi:hypothetical protein